MSFEVVVPQMGESVLEGTIVEWKVKEGDKVKINQPLVEIMTDKINIEIPSEIDGVLEKILAKPGDVVPVGRTIASLSPEGAVPAKGTSAPTTASAAKAPAPTASKISAPVAAAEGRRVMMASSPQQVALIAGILFLVSHYFSNTTSS